MGARPLLESEIKGIQKKARSAAEAAKLLGVSYNTYKKYAKQYLQIRTIECNHQECEVEHVATSNDYEKIKNSFVEFCIIANAKYIKTKSHYDWISNFAKWPALIYDIPLTIME